MWIMAKTWAERLAEVATLKERVAALQTEVAFLTAYSERLVEAVATERARSDVAVDRLLEQKGVSPVTPVKAPTLEDLSSMFEEDPTEVRSIREAIKEQGAGNVLLGNT